MAVPFGIIRIQIIVHAGLICDPRSGIWDPNHFDEIFFFKNKAEYFYSINFDSHSCVNGKPISL